MGRTLGRKMEGALGGSRTRHLSLHPLAQHRRDLLSYQRGHPFILHKSTGRVCGDQRLCQRKRPQHAHCSKSFTKHPFGAERLWLVARAWFW